MELNELKYVCDGIGNSINPILSNLLFYKNDGGESRAQAQNGRFTVDVPSDLPPMLVNAERLLAVWNACDGEPRVSVGDSVITVMSGRLRARISLSDVDQFPRAQPDPVAVGDFTRLPDVLRTLLPFVATDASRPWATTICLSTKGFAYATNNVILARYPLGSPVPRDLLVPGASIETILERGIITGIGASDNAVTFYLAGNIWVRALLVDNEWPTHVVDSLVEGLIPEAWMPVNSALYQMLTVAAKLSDNRHPVVLFKDGGLYAEDESVVATDLAPVPEAGKVNARMAALVFEHTSEVQWHTPKRDVHAFRNGELIGVFGGQR